MAESTRRKNTRFFLAFLLWGMASLPLSAEPQETMGVLELKNTTDLVVEVSNAKNKVVRPVGPSRYALPVGEYRVKARPTTDIAWLWSWSTQVTITAEAPVVLEVPDAAKTPSLQWQLEHEKLQTAKLQSEFTEAKKRQKDLQTLAGWSLTIGGLSTLTAGAFYWLGSSHMQTYHNATSEAEARNLHVQISIESVTFVVTAVTGVLGLGTGLVALVNFPPTAKINDQLQASTARLQLLQDQAAQGDKR